MNPQSAQVNYILAADVRLFAHSSVIHLAGSDSRSDGCASSLEIRSATSCPAEGPRPKPEEHKPVTMNSLSLPGTRPIIGLPSCEKGMSPDQVLLTDRLERAGKTSVACPLLVSIPEKSVPRSKPSTSLSPPNTISPLPLCLP